MLDRGQNLDVCFGILPLDRCLAMAWIALRGLRRLLESIHLEVLLVVELPAELEVVLRRQHHARRFAFGAEPRGVLVADAADGAAAFHLHEVEPRAVAGGVGARPVTIAARREWLELAARIELMAVRALVLLEA